MEGRRRVTIRNIEPEIDGGAFPAKRVIGERVVVRADVFADGHDVVVANLLYRRAGDDTAFRRAPMRMLGNDRWEGSFVAEERGDYIFTVEGEVDRFGTWQGDLRKKVAAGQNVEVELQMGAELVEAAVSGAEGEDRSKLATLARTLGDKSAVGQAAALAVGEELTRLMAVYAAGRFATTYDKELIVRVDREQAGFSAWYELFPRSFGSEPGKHGTFADLEKQLPRIARLGFDIVYLPPIHPIGRTNRKGKNNAVSAEPGDPGSPWAIGAKGGGHKAVHPELGTLEDFDRFVRKAVEHGLEVALDIAFQCSPDHPYVKEHPEWFAWRPDGTIQYAENPPKKYEDIVPFNFETDQWRELWEELKSIVVFWAERGIRIFRIDNPHTKPFSFWQWLIEEVKAAYPDAIFLSEAFTRPKVMGRLAQVGFTQSYTYFTWRNSKTELIDYLTQLTQAPVSDYLRPNFWPNTPDILPEFLQYGGRPAFLVRLALAATLSSNYGIYGPAFELCVGEAVPGREEYLNSEKYELKSWDTDRRGNISELVEAVNRIRRENPALHQTSNLKFYDVDNEFLLFYGKMTDDLSNVILVVVNLDPFHKQSGWVRVPLDELGIAPDQPYMAHDLLGDDHFIWQGELNYVELNPQVLPFHIFRLQHRMRREVDFDYYT